MSRQDANAAFARTSFLYGGNADYIEELYARYEANPGSVDAGWQAFFQSLKDDKTEVIRNAQGASWSRPNWPVRPRDEWVSALDGDWAEVEKAIGDKVKGRAQAAGVELTSADVQQATRDSIRALMLIRAYRIRGHPHANLDPLGLEPRKDAEELDPRSSTPGSAPPSTAASSSTRCSASSSARCGTFSPSCSAPTARRSASSSCTSPIRCRRRGSRSASKARTRRSASPARASARSSA